MSGTVHTSWRWSLSENGERVIALTCPDDGGDIICEWPDAASSNQRWPANARLISAAPELLEALEDLNSVCSYVLSKPYAYDAQFAQLVHAHLDAAKAAIVRAKGETQ